VLANDKLISQVNFDNSIPRPSAGWSDKFENVTLGSQFSADIDIAIANTGEVWVRLGNIHYIGNPIGTMILWQGMHQFNTFRSRFALSKTSAVSSYGFGGNANLSILEPTAGREAITTPSLQILQQLVSQVDRFVSEKIAATLLANVNTSFMEWAYRNSRYDLCSNLRIRLEPNSQSMLLGDIRQLSKTIKYNYFEGSDIETIEQLTTNDSPLIVLSMGQPRRRCEQAYLTKYCNVNRITDAPSVISVKDPNYMTIEESAFVLRLTGILQSDYFVQVGIHFGKISHALPVYIDTTLKPINIILDSDSSSISTILKLYDEDPLAFTGIIKDFIRSVIFPRISNFVPSSTKQGAQAFLKAIRQRRDIFEYEKADSGSLSDIWQKYVNGDLTMTDAAERSTIIVQGTIQTFDRSAARRVSSIIPDVLEHEKYLKPIESSDELEITMALPAITRLDVSSTAKLLTIEDEEPALKGYRCFIALTERARSEQGEFFLQPHRTEIIWSGQKVLYVFLHHSGQFGLYYDIQSNEIISTTPGGKAFQTCTILLKDQIYIPIPDEISERFIPTDEKRKRFEIRFDLLYPNSD
jgi:molecular chaperone HtpG